MKKHYETHVEDTDKLISVAGPILEYKSWYEQYRKLMEEQAQRKYGLYTPTSEGDDDDFPSISGMIARYSALGLTNEQMAANPVWVDKTGNGHDLQMKNFAWKGMSGVGGYVTNKDIYEYDLDRYSYTFIENSTKVHDFYIVFELIGYDENFKDGFNLDVRSISQGLKYRKTYTKNGIYIFQYKDEEGLDDLFAIGYNGNGGARSNFTVKILPLYPGFILGDGVDDEAATENLDLEDTYTVYTPLILPKYGGVVSGKSSAKDFSLNTVVSSKSIGFDSANAWSGSIPVDLFEFALVVCKRDSKTMYIKDLITGKANQSNSKEFVPNPGKYFIWRNTGGSWCQVAIAGQIICNGHFSTDEEDAKVLAWHKKQYPWLFPDQARTVVGKTNEDEDRATIANITGNGNNLVLSNFGFAEGSGYGLYKTPFELYPSVQHSSKYSLSFSKFALGDHNLIIAPKQNDLSYDIKVKVTGLKDGVKFKWGWIGTTGYIDITTDGIHMLNKPASQIRQLLVEFAEDFDPDHVVTIEQIPEYEGYLVTDGVDDKAVSKQFKFGENFTVILDFKFPVKKISYCGFDLSSKVRIQNLQGSGVYVVLKGNKTLIPSNVVRAVTSEGKVYDENWNEYNIVPGNISSNYTMVNLGFDGSNKFAESATKLAGIYSSALSKDDCIKAYNYLQTLKAK